MNKWLNLGRHSWILYWYHPSALSPIIFLFHLNVSSPLSVLYLWQITVSSLTIKSTVAPRDCGSCYPDSKVEETPRHSWAVQEPLEIQSRSISLSSAMVVPPENLNEKHFAAEFADLARSARFCFFFNRGRVTVSIWHLLRQVNLSGGGGARIASHWPKVEFLLSFFFFSFLSWLNVTFKCCDGYPYWMRHEES